MTRVIMAELAAEDSPRLRAPLSGCTMLVYYPQGAYQPVRLDCNPLGGLDSGIRFVVVLSLFFIWVLILLTLRDAMICSTLGSSLI